MSLSAFGQAVADKVRELACNALSNPLIDGRQWGSEPPYRGIGVGDNPLTRRWYNRTIDSYRALVCNEPTPTPIDDTFPPYPFSGGQCCDSRYRVNLSGLESDNSPGTRQASPPFGRVVGTRTGLSAQGFPSVWVQVRDCAGTLLEEFVGAFNTQEQADSWVITSVQVIEGNDDCGDGREPYNPTPTYIFSNVEITYTDNSNEANTALGDFVLIAPVFLPGAITIPFTVDVGGLTLNGTLNLDGTVEFDVNIDLTGGGAGDPVDGDEFPSDDNPDPTTEEPTEEQLRTIVGAWVTLVDQGRRTTIVTAGGTISYYPRWGTLKFRVRTPGGISLSEGVDLKTDQVFVPAPPNASSIGVEFVPYYGSLATIRLAYADVTPIDLVP